MCKCVYCGRFMPKAKGIGYYCSNRKCDKAEDIFKILENNKLTVTIMVGIAGSGKSTWINKNKGDSVVICLDEIRKIFYGHQFHKNAENYIIGDAKNIARLMLSQGKSIIIDSTATRSFIREEWRSIANEFNANCKIVYIKVSKETCLKRNTLRPEGKRVPDDVIERMFVEFQDPIEYNVFYREFSDKQFEVIVVEND